MESLFHFLRKGLSMEKEADSKRESGTSPDECASLYSLALSYIQQAQNVAKEKEVVEDIGAHVCMWYILALGGDGRSRQRKSRLTLPLQLDALRVKYEECAQNPLMSESSLSRWIATI